MKAPTNTPATVGPDYAAVRDRLRDDIIQGVFRSGVRLRLAELAARYDAGYGAVREALQQLQGEGWVELEPNRGARVALASLKRAMDLFDVRTALESHMVVRFLQRASNNMLAELESIEVEFEERANSNDQAGAVGVNYRFHDFINVNADNKEALRILRQNSQVIGSLRRTIGYSHPRLSDICAEHRALIAALYRRDEQEARNIAQEHLRHAAEDFQTRYRAFVEANSDSSP